MQDTKVDTYIKSQDEKIDRIKSLFQEDGILHDMIRDIPENVRSKYMDILLKSEDLQAAVDNFVKDVASHFRHNIEHSPEINVDSINDTIDSDLSSGSLILKHHDNTTEIVNLSDSRVDQTSMNDNAHKTVTTPDPRNYPFYSGNHTQSTQTNISAADLFKEQTASQEVYSLSQPKDGEVRNATAQKPASVVLEPARTTFLMSANGKVNEKYRGKITGVNNSGKTIMIKQVDIPEHLGLSFDVGTCEVLGNPTQAGEFDLKVHYQFDPPSPSDPTPIGICQLIVNPDPKTLWKYLESDRNDRYWKEDTDTIYAPGNDGLAIIVASKRGRSHAHAGTFRDDDFKVDHDVLTKWRIMTVADGAGSAKKSRRGSQVATRVANESIIKALKGDKGQKLQDAIIAFNSDFSKNQRPVMEELYYIFGNAAREAVHAINSEATTDGSAFREFATTLIITVHKKFDFGHFVGAYWVGDGCAAVYLKGRELNVLGKADSGEFAGQTRFLDSSMIEPREIMSRIRFKVVDDFTAVIAMTDGITDPKFETDSNVENSLMWDALWTELEPTIITEKPNEALLDWLDFWSAGNHDDRTIGILFPMKTENTLQQGAN